MTNSPLQTLPDAQLAPMQRAYAEAQAAKNLRLAAMFIAFVIALVLSADVTELNPVKLWERRGELLDYFNHLAHLENGAWVISDPVEWFWNLKGWSLLLLETIVMSYVGTLTGAAVAFVLCFVATPTSHKTR